MMKLRPKKVFTKFNESGEIFDQKKIEQSNPELWKRMKKQFDIGRQIVLIQLNNGIDRLNEKVLRSYLYEFSSRFLEYGPKSFPTSFNVLEPFFIYNHDNSIIQLLDEEEAYGISLVDFLNFVTEPSFSLDKIDFYENIPEGIIYHFSFTSGFDEINFSNSKGKTFFIGGLSMVRQENEVSILMQAGESYDKKEANAYFKKKTRKVVEESITPFKKSIGLEIEGEAEPSVVYYEDRDDLWLHSVAMLFDIEKRSIDIRLVARDENITYRILTDDFNAM